MWSGININNDMIKAVKQFFRKETAKTKYLKQNKKLMILIDEFIGSF